jgi:hypothetical protein
MSFNQWFLSNEQQVTREEKRKNNNHGICGKERGKKIADMPVIMFRVIPRFPWLIS